MLKRYTVVCEVHPSRPVETRCPRCGRPHCVECLGLPANASPDQVTADTICPSCRRELAEAAAWQEEQRRPFWQRIQIAPIDLAIGGSIVLLALLVVVTLAWRLTQEVSGPIGMEVIVRVRMAYAVQSGLEYGLDWAYADVGTTVVRVTSQADDPAYAADGLIDGRGMPLGRYWRSTTATFPQEIVLALPISRTLNAVLFDPLSDAPPETWATDVELSLASDSADGPYQVIGRWSLGQQRGLFPFTPIQAQYIRVRILANGGSPAYVSLNEIAVYEEEQ